MCILPIVDNAGMLAAGSGRRNRARKFVIEPPQDGFQPCAVSPVSTATPMTINEIPANWIRTSRSPWST